ncbi:MAG: hypothetical protein VB017_03325 [Endomicrobiaceae bacterium]|nr:hypothetical protein [Endomicrobiaceae bacterium]
MAKQKKESKNKILPKIYLILLFIAGIILAFSFQTAKKSKTLDVDQMLDNNLVTALTSNGIEQKDVLSQFAREKKDKSSAYNEYYKKIKMPKNKKPENFEPVLKTLARNFKLELSKTTYKDNSFKYVFSDKKRIYSTIVLVERD